jgi:uncharacterized protein (DUF1778 family)
VAAAAADAANHTIERTRIIELSAEDQRRVAEAILKPPPPNAALRRAFRHYRRLIRESR